MQTHHLPVRIPFGEKSQAYWAIAPGRKAFVFVHGFGGSAETTWLEFPQLLQQENTCRGHDLFFYGYESLRTRARPSAHKLIAFLDALFTNPAGLATDSLPTVKRPINFAYDHIVIVAHSLGAVVSRIALLDAYRKDLNWTQKTRLVLYAPAHCGAHSIELASLAFGFFKWAPVEAIARYRFQVLNDLKENSQTLVRLSEQSSQASLKGAAHLKARRVVHAGNDTIVNPADFCDDPVPDIIPDVSHTEVCKPRRGFRLPLDLLLAHS